MPNQRREGQAQRTIWIDEDEWVAAMEIARERGESLSDVMRAALRRYVKRHSDGKVAR